MVNVEPIDSTQQSISDDQELAKVLAGIDQQAEEPTAAVEPEVTAPAVDDAAALPDPTTLLQPDPVAEEPAPDYSVPPVVPPVVAEPVSLAPTVAPSLGTNDDLTAVKQDALNELRPLVDKLNVSPEEKFDTYLLLLRSTDDRELIAPAHEAAKGIADEARRAQALLDIIKEIDFLSQPQQ